MQVWSLRKKIMRKAYNFFFTIKKYTTVQRVKYIQTHANIV